MDSNFSAAEPAMGAQGTNHHPINGVQDTNEFKHQCGRTS
jgi:hypothetical protein